MTLAEQPLILGTDTVTGNPVTLDQEQRLKGMYVIGKTGSGKTTLLVNMILQDIRAGRGLCFFDTHGDAITDILRRLPPQREKDVILLDLVDDEYAFGLNVFQSNDPTSRREQSRIKSSIMEMFAKLFTDTGDMFKEAPTMAETLAQAIPVFLAHTSPRMTLAEVPLLLTDETARKYLLAPVNNILVQRFWRTYDRWKRDQQDKQSDSTRRRVNDFLIDQLVAEIVGQSETTVPFRGIMDERKILLVKLSREHPLMTSLIGSMIVHYIAQAAYSRTDTPEDQRVPFFLYADEYQRFCTPAFAELLAEVRKYKIGTCVAHQFRDQLDKANRGATLNAANMVVFQVSGEDGQELTSSFDCTPPPPVMEEHGRMPILVLAENVMDELKNKGHSGDPRIMQLFNQWCRKLIEQKRQIYINSSWQEQAYDQELHWLNHFLVNAMKQREPIESSEQKQLLVSVIAALGCGFFNFDIGHDTKSIQAITAFLMCYANGKFPKSAYQIFYQERVNFHLSIRHALYTHQSLESEEEAIITRRTHKLQEGARSQLHPLSGFYQSMVDMFNNIKIAPYTNYKSHYSVVTLNSFIRKNFEWLITEGYISATEAGHVVQPFRDRLLNIRVLDDYAELFPLFRNIELFYQEKYKLDYAQIEKDYENARKRAIQNGNPIIMKRLQDAQDSAKKEIYGNDTIAQFVQDMMLLAALLRSDPIRTESGQYEIKYQPGPQRTFADMQAEVANLLTHPQPYTARIKIGSQEHTILVKNLEAPDPDPLVTHRRKRIEEATRDQYCRKRDDVEKEIEQRHKALTKDEPPPTRTRGEEEI